MSGDKQKLALVAGVGVGLLLSAAVLTVRATSGGGTPMRPDSVPADAVWQENAFGSARWIHCAAVESTVVCKAYTASGVEVVSAPYVAADSAPPAPPFAHIVAREVDKIWVNKIALVPNGSVEFPTAKVSITYREGTRVGEPAL